jgi:Asp-tRNA(Asn)/Glu-tRNA(Gln) amidotransferase A subunit family amidase
LPQRRYQQAYTGFRFRRFKPNASKELTEKSAPNETNAFISPPKSLFKSSNSKTGLLNASVSIKDNICTTDYPTTCASAVLKDFQSPYDATVVKLLRKSGAIIHGKTNMDEFGMGSHSTQSHFGPVKTQSGRSAGGSSGGSAVVVKQGWAWA